jgi:hypothetical protein
MFFLRQRVLNKEKAFYVSPTRWSVESSGAKSRSSSSPMNDQLEDESGEDINEPERSIFIITLLLIVGGIASLNDYEGDNDDRDLKD